MVSVDKAVVARFDANGKTFEVLVDPVKALDYKSGKPYGIESLLAVNDVFRDSKKGERAGSSELKAAFGTDDLFKVADIIIKKGTVQVTAEQRRKMVDDKRKQIISIIVRNAINPQTDLPHPIQRIEAALDQTGVKIDPNVPAEEQVPAILKELKPIIPIKFEKKLIAVKFPPAYAQLAIGVVKRSATVKKDQWLHDGSWVVVVEIPAGMVSEFYDTINKLSKGEAEAKELEKI